MGNARRRIGRAGRWRSIVRIRELEELSSMKIFSLTLLSLSYIFGAVL
jgi:hypothetical protein